MTDLTPAMDTALAAANPLVFGAVQIDLPSYTLRLLDGAASLSFNGGTFVGRDTTYGVLTALDPPSDGFGDQAPEISLTLTPPSDSAAATLSNAALQGSRVRLWMGAVTRSTGAVVADPYVLFDGVLDVPTLTVGKGKRELDYRCVSAMERLFDVDEGFRLSDAEQQRVWPGETGLANMSGLAKKIYWGVAGASGAASGSTGAGGSFFGGVAATLAGNSEARRQAD